ncbi:MAG TPA: ribosome recycling factor [Thermodesulfobacteriota bacterium]|nr:ribosome recycling factor [Thermodesulfobacteriota bacterium]
MQEDVVKELKSRMDKTLDSLKKELNKVRTGRASVSLLDSVRVEYYGTLTPLNQLATVSTPESRLITIQPWDTKAIGDIEKAILRSDLGLPPVNDGKIIRINIPMLTEERRKELVKVVSRMVEDSKVALRNHRRDINEKLKDLKKNKTISEDDFFRLQEEVQKVTDEWIKKSDGIKVAKEKEILEF